MQELHAFFQEHAQDGFVSYSTSQEARKLFGCSAHTAEAAILEVGLTPLRYRRNQNSLTQEDQRKLYGAHVLIVGCGGLGGNVAELLARIGVGNLTLVDPDVYEEHNLNRQRFSTIKTLNKPKVECVKRGILAINPALHVKVVRASFGAKNAQTLLLKKSIVIDALDAPATKIILAQACEERNIPFVHGAIGGWMGQCTTSTALATIYSDKEKGAEGYSGNLPMTAALCACLQASLTVKLLLEKPALEKTLLFFDLYDGEIVKMELD